MFKIGDKRTVPLSPKGREVYTLIFVELIKKMFSEYGSDCRTQDSSVLYGICDPAPPLANHIVYSPMSECTLQHLVDSYKRTIPNELILLYRALNGADLFWTSTCIPKTNIHIPVCRLSIFGVPMSNSRDRVEPFNISIEDLNRPHGTPAGWLKFGSFYKSDNLSNRYDLFVDTDSGCVYSVGHDIQECTISETWASIDNCLCNIFSALSEV